MGQMLKLKDGTIHTVLGEADLLSLIENYLGTDMKDAVVQWVNEIELGHMDDDEYIHDLEQIISDRRMQYQATLKKLDEVSKELEDLISEWELDRTPISEITGKLRGVIRKEIR